MVEVGHRPGPAPAVSRSYAWICRHPFVSILAFAFLVRGVLSIAIFITAGGTLFSDDVTYHRLASDAVSGAWEEWSPRHQGLYRTTASFLGPLTALYSLFGPSPFWGQLLAAACGAVTAGFVVLLTKQALPIPWAIGAGALVSLMPSQVLFSSIPLKDPMAWAALSALGVVVARFLTTSEPARIARLGLAVVGSLLILAFLRESTLLVGVWSLVIATLVVRQRPWAPRIAVVVAAAAVVPWLGGLGPAGMRVVLEGPGILAERRVATARAAENTAVDFGTDPGDFGTDPGSFWQQVRYLPRGVSVILLEPLPWRDGNLRTDLARAENLIWYPLLLLSLVGAWTLRDRPAVAVFPLMALGGLAAVYGMGDGNYGTAYRHRGEIVWVVVALATVGSHHLVGPRLRRLVPPPESGTDH